MNTMEITKFVGAICGSLLIFLLIQMASDAIFDTHSDVVAFAVEAPEAAAEPMPRPRPRTSTWARWSRPPTSPRARPSSRSAPPATRSTEATRSGRTSTASSADRSASIGDFSYSDGMKAHGGDWTPAEIFHFLAAPKKDIPGTKMSFAGLPKPEDRADVIAYLETLH